MPEAAMWLTEDVLVVRDLYSPDECESLIAKAENESGFEPASVRTRSGPKMRTDIRDNERATLEDVGVANEMWTRIRDHLPKAEGREPLGVDASLRFYKYTGDQRFKRHKDGFVTRDDGATSRYSYLLYLNDDFGGGETVFTFVSRNDGRREEELLVVRPETGMALLFVHDQWHDGKPVTNGSKYVLRTDVFYG